jgi:hypothetical protein
MRTLLMVGLALALGTMSMAYIFQRDWSVRLTRVHEEQFSRRRQLLNIRDSLQVEVARRASFERLKQLADPRAESTREAAVPAGGPALVALAGSGR